MRYGPVIGVLHTQRDAVRRLHGKAPSRNLGNPGPDLMLSMCDCYRALVVAR